MYQANFGWLITGEELFDFESHHIFPLKYLFLVREILIVYKNTWQQEAAPLKSLIRHRKPGYSRNVSAL